MHSLLSEEELKCWRSFVLGCFYIFTPAISVESLHTGHKFFMEFADSFEKIYGKHVVTPTFIYIAILWS